VATGGALASGKPGLRDQNKSATDPNSEPDLHRVQGHDACRRADRHLQRPLDAGPLRRHAPDRTPRNTYYGRPPSYRGSRFLVPVGTSRVLVKARRNDVDAALDDQVTDALQIQIGWTPRYLVIPR
jgi:hypothetical protein